MLSKFLHSIFKKNPVLGRILIIRRKLFLTHFNLSPFLYVCPSNCILLHLTYGFLDEIN